MKIFVFILLSMVALSYGKAIDEKDSIELEGKIYFLRNFRNVQIITTARFMTLLLGFRDYNK